MLPIISCRFIRFNDFYTIELNVVFAQRFVEILKCYSRHVSNQLEAGSHEVDHLKSRTAIVPCFLFMFTFLAKFYYSGDLYSKHTPVKENNQQLLLVLSAPHITRARRRPFPIHNNGVANTKLAYAATAPLFFFFFKVSSVRGSSCSLTPIHHTKPAEVMSALEAHFVPN
jgi:hypothetical protein